MLKTSVASSVLKNSFDAGKEISDNLKDNNQKLVLMFSSANYDQSKLIEGFKSIAPNAKIVGNTSFTGVITPTGFVGGDTFIGAMSFNDEDLNIGIGCFPKGDCPIETGEKVAKEAMKCAGFETPPDYFFMVASPGEEEFYLKGITKIIGRVPFFGGSSADNTISGDWKLFADKTVVPDGVAVAFFYTKSKCVNLYTGAYCESNKSGIITKLEGNRTLVEIDGIPAIEKYAEWSGKKVENLLGGNLLAETICNPLGVKDRLGDLIAIRHPMFGNDNLSMNIGSNLSVNTAVIYMEGSVDGLINSAGETLRELNEKIEKPVGYYLVHCGGRRAGIGDRIDEVYKKIKNEAKDVPFLVEFTFGEYGFESDGNNTCGGLMLSFTGFAN